MGESRDRAVGLKYGPDCLAWLQSGCNPALAEHDPVLTPRSWMSAILPTAERAGPFTGTVRLSRHGGCGRGP